MAKTVRTSCILTTTRPIAAYGGIQLGPQILKDLADSIRSGKLPMTRNHDPRRPFEIANVESGVRENADGYLEAWAEFDVDEEAWNRFRGEVDAAGAPGGMSFTMRTPITMLPEGPNDRDVRPLVTIAADAHHFSDDQIVDAAAVIADQYPVAAERLYQFEQVPQAVVVLAFAADQLKTVPVGVLANLLTDGLKKLLRRQPSATPSTPAPYIFQFAVDHDGSSTTVVGHLETADPAVLRAAIEQLPDIIERTTGAADFDLDTGRWEAI